MESPGGAGQNAASLKFLKTALALSTCGGAIKEHASNTATTQVQLIQKVDEKWRSSKLAHPVACMLGFMPLTQRWMCNALSPEGFPKHIGIRVLGVHRPNKQCQQSPAKGGYKNPLQAKLAQMYCMY